MKKNSIIQKVRKQTLRLKQKMTQSILAFTPIRLFSKNKTGVSAVISNIILIAAVIVVGMATLAWVQSQSADYQKTQTGVVNQDVSQLQERLSFEYVSYGNPTLTVYVLNSGTINGLNVTSIQVGANPPVSVTNLHLLDGTSVKSLNIGQDGYFTANIGTLNPGTTYTIKVITSRGSSFVSNYAQ